MNQRRNLRWIGGTAPMGSMTSAVVPLMKGITGPWWLPVLLVALIVLGARRATAAPVEAPSTEASAITPILLAGVGDGDDILYGPRDNDEMYPETGDTLLHGGTAEDQATRHRERRAREEEKRLGIYDVEFHESGEPGSPAGQGPDRPGRRKDRSWNEVDAQLNATDREIDQLERDRAQMIHAPDLVAGRLNGRDPDTQATLSSVLTEQGRIQRRALELDRWLYESESHLKNRPHRRHDDTVRRIHSIRNRLQSLEQTTPR